MGRRILLGFTWQREGRGEESAASSNMAENPEKRPRGSEVDHINKKRQKVCWRRERETKGEDWAEFASLLLKGEPQRRRLVWGPTPTLPWYCWINKWLCSLRAGCAAVTCTGPSPLWCYEWPATGHSTNMSATTKISRLWVTNHTICVSEAQKNHTKSSSEESIFPFLHFLHHCSQNTGPHVILRCRPHRCHNAEIL